MSDHSTERTECRAGVQQQLGRAWEYEDARGIRIDDPTWDCPGCSENGRLMYRPGSKDTCATCFHVVNGRKNDLVLDNLRIDYRTGQRLLAAEGEDWHGSPGTVSNTLRRVFGSEDAVVEAASSLEEVR